MLLLGLRNLLLVFSLFVIAEGTLDLTLGGLLSTIDEVVAPVTNLVLSIPLVTSLLGQGCSNGVKLGRYMAFFNGVNKNKNQAFEYEDYNDTAAVLLSVPNYQKLNGSAFYDKPKGLVPKAFNVFPIFPLPLHVYLLLATIVSAVQPVLVDRVNRLGELMFTAFDYKGKGDNVIDREECCGMWMTFGVSQSDCRPEILDPCYDELDRNNDGKIDFIEFKVNALDFFNSSDPNCRCRYLLGPNTGKIPEEVVTKTYANPPPS